MPEQLQNHFDLLGVKVTYLESNRPVVGSDVPDANVVIVTWWETAEWALNFPPANGQMCILFKVTKFFP